MSEEKKVPTRPLPKLTELDTAEFGAAPKIKSFGIKSVPIAEPWCGIPALIAPAV